jgi:hypothetical protein
MQNRSAAAQALCGEESGGAQRTTRNRRSQHRRQIAHRHRLHFHRHVAGQSRFALFRFVCQHAACDRHSGRGSTQRQHFGHARIEAQFVQTRFRQLATQAAAASLSTGLASSDPMFIERDFSSFIIGEGVVTAFFILMVR